VTRGRITQLALTVHVTASVGWLGAVIAFLGLAVIGFTHTDAEVVRGTYLAMEPAASSVLVPLAITSLLTGIVQGWLTRWGVFQHYWVVFKLVITAVATSVLLVYIQTFDVMADAAADKSADLEAVRNPSPILHAAAAFVLLLVATGLAVFKPRGLTPYGRRKQHAAPRSR
jgi:uncharacterized membrane protein